ncbi:glycosyltransferase family 2 protein [Lactonifactor longoviformis]|uniref:glycosyltransferase family 2 protein n=1 Tax=Lactonifactor longoviformis TaxID=341220 RepID=UPI0036F395CA
MISIIVPAYNAEKTVKKAVESAIHQTYKELEIIIVDDGSKDNTRKILEQMAGSDTRIKLIKKDQNEGLSAARNSGMSCASGEYLTFLDADDWIDVEHIEKLLEADKERHSDLIIGGYTHETMNETRTEAIVKREVKVDAKYIDRRKEILKSAVYFDSKKVFAYTCIKLYKTNIINDNNLQFEKCPLIEDFLFNVKYWNYIKSLSSSDNTGYHYVKATSEALTQRFLPNYFELINVRLDAMRSLLQQNNLYVGNVRTMVANVHIKHCIAAMVRNNAEAAGFSIKEIYRENKRILKHENSVEAAKYAKGSTIQERVCNLIFKTKCASLNSFFAYIVCKMQNSKGAVFDKLK